MEKKRKFPWFDDYTAVPHVPHAFYRINIFSSGPDCVIQRWYGTGEKFGWHYDVSLCCDGWRVEP